MLNAFLACIATDNSKSDGRVTRLSDGRIMVECALARFASGKSHA